MYLGRSLEYEEVDVVEVDIAEVVDHAEEADSELIMSFELAMNQWVLWLKSAVGSNWRSTPKIVALRAVPRDIRFFWRLLLIDRKMFTPSLAFESLNSNVILARTPEFFSILDAEEELGADNDENIGVDGDRPATRDIGVA